MTLPDAWADAAQEQTGVHLIEKNTLRAELTRVLDSADEARREVVKLRGELRAAERTIQERTSWANCGGVPTGIKCRVDGHEIFGGFQADADRSNAICDIHLLQETTAQLRAAVMDTARLDKLERILDDEIYYNDILLQSDSEDGVWIALRDKGTHGALVEDGQEERAATLRAAIDAVPDRGNNDAK